MFSSSWRVHHDASTRRRFDEKQWAIHWASSYDKSRDVTSSHVLTTRAVRRSAAWKGMRWVHVLTTGVVCKTPHDSSATAVSRDTNDLARARDTYVEQYNASSFVIDWASDGPVG